MHFSVSAVFPCRKDGPSHSDREWSRSGLYTAPLHSHQHPHPPKIHFGAAAGSYGLPEEVSLLPSGHWPLQGHNPLWPAVSRGEEWHGHGFLRCHRGWGLPSWIGYKGRCADSSGKHTSSWVPLHLGQGLGVFSAGIGIGRHDQPLLWHREGYVQHSSL